MCAKSPIPEDFLNRIRIRTLGMLSAQVEIPLSPVSVGASGEVNLCAAACFAKAGLEIKASATKAAEFEKELVATRSFALVEVAFSELGFGVPLCRAILAQNDEAPPSRRREVVNQLFASLGRTESTR
jgi:hypothetical protein